MEKVKAGVVGVGQMGQYHVGVYSELFNVQLVGIADCDRTRALTMAERYNTQAYEHYHDLLDAVDVVSIAAHCVTERSIEVELPRVADVEVVRVSEGAAESLLR